MNLPRQRLRFASGTASRLDDNRNLLACGMRNSCKEPGANRIELVGAECPRTVEPRRLRIRHPSLEQHAHAVLHGEGEHDDEHTGEERHAHVLGADCDPPAQIVAR
jgi:hypothetical protein